jgi:hypothetical protein
MTVGITAGNTANISIVSVSCTPAESAAVTAVAQTFTVPGVKVGDVVLVTPPSNASSVSVGGAWASAADTVSVQFINPTAGNLTAPSGTYIFTIFRRDGAATGMVNP